MKEAATAPRTSAHPARPAALPLFPLAIAAGLFLLLLAVVLKVSLGKTGGVLVYALDDAYIHMAIAKNVALHGVFGVTSHGFSSSSSSILWPLLLAAIYKLIGVSTTAPLVLEAVFGLALLALAWQALREAGVDNAWFATAALCTLVLTVPMVAMAMSGMEHLMQAASVLLCVQAASRALRQRQGNVLGLMLCAALASAVRYEGAFLVAAVALLLALKRRLPDAVAVAGCGALPIVLFGLYSRARGGFFLPNSLVVKGRPLGWDTLQRPLLGFRECPELYVLLAMALLTMALARRGGRTANPLAMLFVLCSLAHMTLASFGWFFRYEAYLIALGTVAVFAAAWPERETLRAAGPPAALAALALCVPLILRASDALQYSAQACHDIYRQQYQMARFLQEYYPGARVALNDIGAASFYADPQLTDLIGLGDTDVLRARREDHSVRSGGGYVYAESLAVQRAVGDHSPEIAIVYDTPFGFAASRPQAWERTGSWRIPERMMLGYNVVSFYGVGDDNAVRLRERLLSFHNELPPELRRYATP